MAISPTKPSKILGVVAMVLGACWAAPWVFFALSALTEGDGDIVVYLFVAIMMPLLALPGVLAVFFGFKLFRHTVEHNIRMALGSLTVLAAFSLGSVASARVPVPLDDHVRASLFIFLAAMALIPVYISILRYLLRTSGLETHGPLIGRGFLFVLAFLIHTTGSAMVSAYSPLKETELWGGLIFVSPIVFAIVFYKLGTRFLLAGEQPPVEKVSSA